MSGAATTATPCHDPRRTHGADARSSSGRTAPSVRAPHRDQDRSPGFWGWAIPWAGGGTRKRLGTGGDCTSQISSDDLSSTARLEQDSEQLSLIPLAARFCSFVFGMSAHKIWPLETTSPEIFQIIASPSPLCHPRFPNAEFHKETQGQAGHSQTVRDINIQKNKTILFL